MADGAAPSETRTTLPGGGRRRVAVFRPSTAALVVGGLATIASLLIDHVYGGVREQLLFRQVERQVVPAATALETAIQRRMALLRGLGAFVEVRWGRPDLPADFDRFAAELMKGAGGVRTLQYVRNGIIVHTWPLAGNEAVIGRNLFDDPRPEISGDLRRAMADSVIVLSGPLTLFQGGQGVVGRLAVRSAADSVVGVAGIVLDFAPILNDAGLGGMPGLWLRLLDQEGRPIAGKSDLALRPGEEAASAPVRLPDRRWVLEAVPAGGWQAGFVERQLPVRVTLILGTLLLAGLAWLLQSRQEQRALAEQERVRRRGEEKFERLFALTMDGVTLTRMTDGRMLEVNDAFVELTGWTREELVGFTTLERRLWPSADDRTRMVELIHAQGRVRDYSAALARADGSIREVRLSARVVTIDGEKCLLVMMRDVHEQRQLERRLAEAARLEAVGRLAGGIAHDFNNLITGIAGYAVLLADRLEQDPGAVADLEEIRRASARAADLTRQLLAFARRQVVQPKTVDLNAIVVGSDRLLRQLVGEKVRLTISIWQTPAMVLIDPAQVDQLLTNLAVNARDAMPDGGSLTMQTVVEEHEIQLTVSDTGMGMAPEVRAHIFEPFYTTKPAGQGTGLGLATCYGIVQQAGGRIDVFSQVGAGTTFRVVLPRSPELAAVTPSVEAPSLPLSPGGAATILIAEDEAQVRRLAERVLTNLGYTVLVAADGREALEVAMRHLGPIDLLITDMVMPGLGGGELSRRLRELRPDVALLLMSGYSEELVASEHGDAPFLPKPFMPMELAEAVQRILEGRRAGR